MITYDIMAKILIADDSRFQVEMLGTWLRHEGFEVLTAADALQAWTSALRLIPDAIVLDINMPAGSGVQVLKRLRTSAKTQNIPVIVVSGNEDVDVRSVIEQLGAAAFRSRICVGSLSAFWASQQDRSPSRSAASSLWPSANGLTGFLFNPANVCSRPCTEVTPGMRCLALTSHSALELVEIRIEPLE